MPWNPLFYSQYTEQGLSHTAYALAWGFSRGYIIYVIHNFNIGWYNCEDCSPWSICRLKTQESHLTVRNLENQCHRFHFGPSDMRTTMSQLKKSGREDKSNLPPFAFYSGPLSINQIMPTDNGESHLLSLPYQMLIASTNILRHTQKKNI
jgi:hypothetical protein